MPPAPVRVSAPPALGFGANEYIGRKEKPNTVAPIGEMPLYLVPVSPAPGSCASEYIGRREKPNTTAPIGETPTIKTQSRKV
ncbi:hypothetical protein AMTR_s00129p00069410 [Amborella trichopoda]|uniref:Uncharacterized protein n=1 Tax=Amborella trichopoda TaxID=13333 RepID=W1NKM8_AMBTC|nr:hypothetical protein AMTR_s00129p00069410 [Amborella trichopoda]